MLGSVSTNPVQLSCSNATASHPCSNFYKLCSVQLYPRSSIPPSAQVYKPCSSHETPCNNSPPSAQFLQLLFNSVVPAQLRDTLSSIFTTLNHFSFSHTVTSHPRLSFHKPCSAHFPRYANIPASPQFLQALFSSAAPMQLHPILSSIFTNPAQPIIFHIATSRCRLNFFKPCSVQLGPIRQYSTIGSIFTNPSHASTSHLRLNLYKPYAVQFFPSSEIPPLAQSLQTLFRSVVTMRQHPNLGSIFANPVQFSCSGAGTFRPRRNFYKPCSVQLPPCNSIPPSAQVVTTPVQLSFSHAAPFHPWLNFYKPCSVPFFRCKIIPPLAQFLQTVFRSLAPMQSHSILGSIFIKLA